MEGVNSNMVCHKNFCKCHKVLQYNNNIIIKIKNKYILGHVFYSCKCCIFPAKLSPVYFIFVGAIVN
jgi:hypothetical protein